MANSINDIEAALGRAIKRVKREAERPSDMVWVKDVKSGYHSQLTRERRAFFLEHYPERYRPASGPDNLPEGEWAQYDEEGDVIDVSYSLDDPNLSDEDRARIRAHRETLPLEIQADPDKRLAYWKTLE